LNGLKDPEDERILTWEQAIAGIDGNPLYAPVKRNTSPGFGWSARGSGKTAWLGSGENYIFDNPEVLARRDELMERLQNNGRTGSVFVDTLKDERRPIEKVDQGKTRLFAAGEMVFCLIFRQYFMGFMAHVMRNCIAAESCVGINAFGYQWNQMVNKIKEVGPHNVAGDFSNYDGTLNAAALWAVLDVVENFYSEATDEERMIRRGLWCDLVNSVHYTLPFIGASCSLEGILYQWTHSQPSGNPMTVILNSVYHSLVARYVFKMCARKYCPDKVGLDNWSRYVRHLNYGDDDLYNIDPEICSWFNQITMAEAFEEIGMTYTDEAKTGSMVATRELHEIAFLKRKFRWDDAQMRWRAPHSMDTITEMAMWIKGSKNIYELTAETLEEAVHELAQQERAVFDEFIPVFEEARTKILPRSNCVYLTYDEYQEVDAYRAGMISNLCDRDSEVIAKIDRVTAAVGAESLW